MAYSSTKILITAALLLGVMPAVMAQQTDDLTNILNAEKAQEKSEPVIAVFKSTKIINAHTTEMLKKRNLDFRVAHRFGNMGTDLENTVDNFFLSSDIRIAFEYGVTDNLMVGISRNKTAKNLEGFVKYRILRQTTDGKVPVSLVVFANSTYSTIKNDVAHTVFPKDAYRMTYAYQAIVSRKINPSLSLEVLGSLVHRNYVADARDRNDLYSIGVGGRIKVTRSSAIIVDYFYTFRDDLKDPITGKKQYYLPLGIGWEIETGGHVFSLMFTNSAGIIENQYIPNTTESWLDGAFKFSFNISRVFKL